ncbi:MAG: hypothetical protein M1832_004742 [Thelocarpon impressellum]|nr:MAG: hypothetical protein M1832_004742 [Thelocarpon impressellum]
MALTDAAGASDNVTVQSTPPDAAAPKLGEGFSKATETASSASVDETPADAEPADAETATAKAGKRKLFGFGKKREGDEKAPLPGELPRSGTTSPPLSAHPYQSPSSPPYYRAGSPHIPSPASSQIFERNVQESTLLPAQSSPAIPSHIQTEDHIPPVLEASSLALTDGHLNPDNVEIVMHSAHQPAAVTVTGASNGGSEATGNNWSEELVAHPDNDDAASNYGALDANDVRRLSFISFADVMQAEHVDHAAAAGQDPLQQAGLSSMSSIPATLNRSPSPIRSPGSSHAPGTTPPTSVPASLQGLDASPSRGIRGPGSPTSAGSPPHVGSELTIETMTQALRKTGSGDLSGVMSQPLSAASAEDGLSDHHWK